MEYHEVQAALTAYAVAVSRLRSTLHTVRGIKRDGTWHPALVRECVAAIPDLRAARRAAWRRLALARTRHNIAWMLA